MMLLAEIEQILTDTIKASSFDSRDTQIWHKDEAATQILAKVREMIEGAGLTPAAIDDAYESWVDYGEDENTRKAANEVAASQLQAILTLMEG